MQLLVVEDDEMLAAALQQHLQRGSWRVDCVGDAVGARLALTDHGYQAVLLDLGLPQGSGLSVLQFLRTRYDPTPVIIATARDQLSDRIQGLDAGADDYLVKPFQLDELEARLRAVLRRAQGRVAPVLTHGDIVIDPSRQCVERGGRRVALSVHEYRTLLALMERRGRTVTRDQLQDAVYGGASSIESNTIAVYVHQLRRKLGDQLITTVHGFGYSIAQEAMA
jgi:two-component system, OmpR family, response regulator